MASDKLIPISVARKKFGNTPVSVLRIQKNSFKDCPINPQHRMKLIEPSSGAINHGLDPYTPSQFPAMIDKRRTRIQTSVLAPGTIRFSNFAAGGGRQT
ncbi:unnamed protein product [Pieris brassicae]|uniref:Uncharacterized protein n=1 Tax=Pieris brassicae TaxID=7116 RepID=A0A9P0TC64_PIEBR|nr:unnamed protein product [Pieris brassicae]